MDGWETRARDSCRTFNQIHALFTFYHICLIFLAFLLLFLTITCECAHTHPHMSTDMYIHVCLLSIQMWIDMETYITYKHMNTRV